MNKPALPHYWITVLVAVVAAVAGYWLASHKTPLAVPVTKAAPPLAWQLADLQGKPQSPSQYAGKLVLLNFWASWCSPCMNELPMLVKAQEKYAAQGLQILGPAMDDPEEVKKVVQRLKINYPVMVSDEALLSIMESYGNPTGGLPFTVWLRDGEVLHTTFGELKPEELSALLVKYLL